MKKSIPPILIIFALVCFALAQKAQAVVPPPDGGYPNRNTAEGQNALFNLTTGTDNTAVGLSALWNDTTGSYNTATGEQTLYLNVSGIYNTATGYRALYSNTSSKNTADGFRALYSNTNGDQNTATGFQALFSNTTGARNTAMGLDALYSNTIGTDNTAIGFQALFHNINPELPQTGGVFNTALGSQALFSNTSGTYNTAVGYQALYNNIGGEWNTATGNGALISNTSGSFNAAFGFDAFPSNTTGSSNTAIGVDALFYSTVGNANVAIGNQALFNNTGDSNTAIGNAALLSNTGMANIALGSLAGSNLTTGDNNIDIGNVGVGGEANTIRIGTEGTQTATFIAGISGATVTGTAVVVNGSGQLGVAPSSKRFKDQIKPMDKASEAILGLKPVIFRYKKELDPDGIPQFGLVAEQVEKVNPDLVARDAKGEVYTVRYEAVNAMLLNEFLKEHRKVEEQGATIIHQRKDFETAIARLQKQIGALTAGLQEVSAQLEVSKTAPQTVKNND
jgi:trimeric autotransporter adhesin